MAALGLDERVVDVPGLEPGEQVVAKRVRADRGGDAMTRAVSGDRYRRRTYRMSSSLWPCSPTATARIPVLVP
jgi:hypothetical protein